MASAKFHAHTATGKLNAEMTSTGPERMPGLHHPVARPLGGDGQAVELARQADREVADVDHLLHFAEAFLEDLARLRGDQAAERRLARAQLLAEQADQLAALRRRHAAPGVERVAARAILASIAAASSLLSARDLAAVDRRAHLQVAALERARVEADGFADVIDVHRTLWTLSRAQWKVETVMLVLVTGIHDFFDEGSRGWSATRPTMTIR